MSRFIKPTWITLSASVIFLTSFPTKAHAIPYFARKYKTTCSRCHSDVPKLNSFGKNFQLHGYQQPGDKLVNKIVYPEDKNLLLPDQLPIAFLIENQVQLDKAVGNPSANNVSAPLAFHLFAADTFAPDFGFFGELASDNGVVSVGKVSLTVAHLGGQNLFVQLGNLDPTEHGVTEHDLFGRNGYAVQDLGLATSNGFQVSAQHMGIRLYGLLGSAVSPALIHGKDSGNEKDSGGDETPGKNADPDLKDAGSGKPMPMAMPGLQKMTRVAEETEQADPMDQLKGFLWEVGVYNSTVSGTASPTPNPSDFEARVNAYFNGDSFIGLAGYSGLMTQDTGGVNHYQVGGPDFSFYFGKPFEKTKGLMVKPFNLMGGYLAGQATNPDGGGLKTSWNGYYLEQDYMLNPRSVAFLRYDKVNGSNLDRLSPTITNGLTANYTYYLRTNCWVGVEYTHDLSSAKQNLLGVLFNFAF